MHHPYFQFTNGDVVTPPVVQVPYTPPSGGHPWIGPYKRREFYQSGIRAEVVEVIESVAKRQIVDLDLPKRLQALQLQRALKLKAIQYETRYFEALSIERELLIEIEIGERLREKLLMDDLLLLLALAATV